MKFIWFLAVAASGNAFAIDQTIEPMAAKTHVDRTIVACGLVSEVKVFSKGTYVTFGPQFPLEHLTAVIWESDSHAFVRKFGALEGLKGRGVCVRGKVNTYKGHTQIELVGPDRLTYAK